ncbi:MAG TPA: SDR family oxidoreductase [Tepidisphaeraceae bacterium]|nr:SDR family oxidoreductase [Tepidisphaeraceae bacterium]
MAGRFSEKVCLVTGGGSGIGLATAQQFASEGAKVLIIDLNPAHGDQAVQTITDAGGQAAFAKCDVGDSVQVQAAVKMAVDKWGRIDVLVNNAAMMTFLPTVELPDDAWDHVLRVNLKGVFMFCKCAIPHMPPGSAIVNTSSVHAHETEAGVGPYAASKGGMEAFVRVLVQELETQKIRVNCVAPGAVNTPMLWNNPNVKSGKEKIQGAVGQPADIAAAICFLASPEARFVNGTTLVVDGARLDIL